MTLRASLILRVGIVAATTAAGAVWVHVRGPVPIIRFTTELAEPMPNWYTITAFPVLGMLLADAAVLVLLRAPRLEAIERGGQIGILLAVSHLRLGIQIPVSGHVMLMTYFVLRRLSLGVLADPIRHVELATAVLLLVLIGYGKLVWWDDPYTFLLGALAGGALAFVSWRIVRRSAGAGARRSAEYTENIGARPRQR